MAEEQRHDIAELYTKMTLGQVPSFAKERRFLHFFYFQMTRELPYFNWKMFFNEVFADIKTKVDLYTLGRGLSKICSHSSFRNAFSPGPNGC